MTIAGHVLDEVDHSPVAGAEVVVRGPLGEQSTITRPDGAFSIEVARGAYRVAARGGGVITAGAEDRERLETGPNAAIVGLPDDTLMPVVEATRSVANLELALPREATIAGTVVDREGRRIAHAIVRAHGALRPAFGTDVAETDEAGNYTLVVPAGRYHLEAGAPELAGSLGPVEITAVAHATAHVQLVLAKGCEIRGKVVRADGKPAADGAIERRSVDRNLDFGPAGRIEPDGTFRWATLDEADVTLRAWPWKSAATDERTFSCHDGARFTGVVLRVRSEPAAVHGTLVDATGTPVPFGYVDVEALDPGLASQQERADAEGHFEIHDLPFGRYQVEAAAAGRGIAVTTVAAPRDEALELRLGGTGRIEGTTTALANGTLAIELEACFDALDLQHRPMPIAHEPRLVTVRGGRFAIDDAPACDLLLVARWHEQRVQARVVVSPSQLAHVELELGPPHEKLVHGTIRDRDAHPVANASVTAIYEGRRTASVTDAAGHYSVKSFAGAQLTASDGSRRGDAQVGRANVPDEQVDVVIDRAD
ncbi:MAG: carboxypeptidase regulatory-like domain-containing protein [Acidobacteriota bacterium]